MPVATPAACRPRPRVGFHRLRRAEAVQRGRIAAIDPSGHAACQFVAGPAEILVDDVDGRPEQVQQLRRLFRHDVDVAAERQAGILDAGDDRQRCGAGAADMPSGLMSRRISCAVCARIWSIEWSMVTVLNGMAAAPVSISPSRNPLTRVVVIGEGRRRRQQREPAAAERGELAHRLQREGVVVEIVERVAACAISVRPCVAKGKPRSIM